MSQYPSPYPPTQQPQPPYYGGPPQSLDDPRAPARRAGVLMIVLGVLFVLAGLCTAFMGWMITQPEMTRTPEGRQAIQQMEQFEAQFGTSAQTVFTVLGGVVLAAGAVFGAMGFFVRGGGLVPVVVSMILSGVCVLALAFVILAGLLQGGASGNPQVLLSVCVYCIPLAMMVLLFFWLVQALRASSKIELARQQQQAQMWQYQQQQQMYRQPGAGPMAGQGPVQGPGWPTAPPPTSSGGYHGYPGPQYTAPPPPSAPGIQPPADPSSTRPADSGNRPDGPPPDQGSPPER